MKRTPLVVAFLLILLAALMASHLSVLMAKDQSCRQYERTLMERLIKTAPGSPQAVNIRNEIQYFFDGRYSDCSRTSTDFNDASDKFLAVILSLITGAGVVVASDQGRIADRILNRNQELEERNKREAEERKQRKPGDDRPPGV